jgi:hypothetical protein
MYTHRHTFVYMHPSPVISIHTIFAFVIVIFIFVLFYSFSPCHPRSLYSLRWSISPFRLPPFCVFAAAVDDADRGRRQAARQQQEPEPQGQGARQPRLVLLHCAVRVGSDSETASFNIFTLNAILFVCVSHSHKFPCIRHSTLIHVLHIPV